MKSQSWKEVRVTYQLWRSRSVSIEIAIFHANIVFSKKKKTCQNLTIEMFWKMIVNFFRLFSLFYFVFFSCLSMQWRRNSERRNRKEISNYLVNPCYAARTTAKLLAFSFLFSSPFGLKTVIFSLKMPSTDQAILGQTEVLLCKSWWGCQLSKCDEISQCVWCIIFSRFWPFGECIDKSTVHCRCRRQMYSCVCTKITGAINIYRNNKRFGWLSSWAFRNKRNDSSTKVKWRKIRWFLFRFVFFSSSCCCRCFHSFVPSSIVCRLHRLKSFAKCAWINKSNFVIFFVFFIVHETRRKEIPF